MKRGIALALLCLSLCACERQRAQAVGECLVEAHKLYAGSYEIGQFGNYMGACMQAKGYRMRHTDGCTVYDVGMARCYEMIPLFGDRDASASSNSN